MKKLLTFILILPLFLFSFDFTSQWKEIKSLNKQHLPKSALEKVKHIYTQARKDKDSVQIIRAILYKKNYTSTLNEDGEVKAIQMIEKSIEESTSMEEKAILTSVLAEMYQNYYNQNRYKIKQRTKIKNTILEDIQTWSSEDFLNKTYVLYQDSLDPSSQNVDIKKYQEILSEAKNVEGLRPTLYDLLVVRALNYFQNQSSYLHQVKEFNFKNKDAFSTAPFFSTLSFEIEDEKNLKYQTALLFQKLLNYHSNQGNQKALEYLDLQRLQFVRRNYSGEDTDKYYLEALNRLLNANKNSEALLHLINYYHEQANHEKTLELIALAHKSTNPFVKQSAKSIENSIKEKRLSIQIEKVNLPHENILTSVAYRNVEKIFVKVFKPTPSELLSFNQIAHHKNKVLNYLETFKNFKTLNFKLPKTNDHKEHSTELSLEAYDLGQYIFLFSTNKEFKKEKFFKQVTVSNLSYFKRANRLLILHRKSGEPLENVKITLINHNAEVLTKYSNAKGFVELEKIKQRYGIQLEYKEDILALDNYLNRSYNPYYNDKEKQRQVYFFTDRAIYRPGQTIYFKGLLAQSYLNQKPKILANEKVIVSFSNNNRQKVEEKTFVTDEFGAFHGQFTAPKSGRLGSMTINSNIGGRTHFRVEEYKRPKFEVTFEPNKVDYALGDTIRLKGLVKAYAGNVIDNAKVKFTVERQAQFYWYRPNGGGYPSRYGNSHINNGTVSSNKKGEFTVQFIAEPDTQYSSQPHVSYSYIISVEVTDSTGETQYEKNIFNIGRTNLKINIKTSNKQFTDENNTLTLETTDLNGEFKAVKGYINVEKVLQEKKLYRERYWSQGDKKMYTKEAFEKRFPSYRYENKKTEKRLFETLQFDTAMTKTISLNHLPQGEYVLTLNTTNKYGEELTQEKKILLIDKQDKELLKPSFLSLEEKDKHYKIAEQAILNIKSSLPHAQVLFRLEQYGKTLEEKWIQLQNFHQEMIEIKKAYQGNVYYSLQMVANNRHFTKQGRISVPWDSKLKVEYLSFRDKLKPNEKEQWKVKISGENKEKVMAQMVATMYDASLDALYAHNYYDLNLYPYSPMSYGQWRSPNFRAMPKEGTWREEQPTFISRQFSHIKWLNSYNENKRHMMRMSPSSGYGGVAMPVAAPSMMMESQAGDILPSNYASSVENTKAKDETLVHTKEKPKNNDPINIRTNLKETMFFKPNLQTDEEGNIIIDFTTNEALTRWNFMAFVHTKDLKTAITKKTLTTSKELMVVTNLPRFFREKDQITLSAKVVNMSEKDLNGTCELKLVDPVTEKPIFEREFKQNVSIKKGASTVVEFKFTVPNVDEVSAIKHTIIAKTATHSDAEQIIQPILSNRVFITESKNMFVKAHEEKSFTLESLKNNASTTLSNHKLTLEFTSNPAWYAIKSLPYLMEYPHECNEQLFNRYFANALAAKIANSSPKIKEVFESWKSKGELISALETNKELKSVLLEETPWVLNAKSEAEQQANLGVLFDLVRLAKEEEATYNKLIKRQFEHSNGGWAWFESPHSNWYITQYIVEGFGKLKKLGIDKTNTEAMGVATHYMDMQMLEQYQNLLKDIEEHGAKLEDDHLSSMLVHYLYARSFYSFNMDAKIQEAHNYYLEQSKKYWVNKGLYEQGMIALTLDARQEKDSALAIVKSLKERALVSNELGMYFKYNNGYYWNQMPIETHALMIDVFDTVANDKQSVELMKTWLLKNKQTTHWKTTKATASAIYALLSNVEWLDNDKQVELSFDTTLPYKEKLEKAKVQAGTGYMKVDYKNFDQSMATVKVNNPNDSIAWGALYWQYFEEMDKVKNFKETPLTINKKLYLIEKTNTDEVLSPITNQELKVGDKVKVRIELRVDRDMEYIMLKDARASAFEPLNVLSRYKYQDGLGYYESTKDNATYFFMDYLRKGTYVFEYPLVVTHKGDFSNGITTIESMYAPEFKSHSEGVRVLIK